MSSSSSAIIVALFSVTDKSHPVLCTKLFLLPGGVLNFFSAESSFFSLSTREVFLKFSLCSNTLVKFFSSVMLLLFCNGSFVPSILLVMVSALCVLLETKEVLLSLTLLS